MLGGRGGFACGACWGVDGVCHTSGDRKPKRALSGSLRKLAILACACGLFQTLVTGVVAEAACGLGGGVPNTDSVTAAGKECASQEGILRWRCSPVVSASMRRESLSRWAGSNKREASSVVEGAVETVEGVVATEKLPSGFGSSACKCSMALSAGLGTLESMECAVVLSSSWSFRSFVRRYSPAVIFVVDCVLSSSILAD